MRTGELKKVVVFIDADNSFEQETRTLHRALEPLGLPTPQANNFASGRLDLEIGFYIFPKEGQLGELEDLLEEGHEDPLLQQARDFFIRLAGERDLNKSTKRVFQIYLALISQPLCAGVGRAINNNSLQVDINNFEELRRFLDRAVVIN